MVKLENFKIAERFSFSPFFSLLEYGKKSKLFQLTEGDSLRLDAIGLSPIKSMNCIVIEVGKLIPLLKDIDNENEFEKIMGGSCTF